MQANKPNRKDGGREDKARWLIYPDYWKKTWGEPPCLGQVYADDEFEAIRKAYDKGLLRINFTFGPKPVRTTEARTKPAYHRHKR